MTKHLIQYTLLLFILFSCKSKQTQTETTTLSIKWQNWDLAQNNLKHEKKKVLVKVYTDWCHYCKKMNKKTFTDPDVVRYINKHFIPVAFNGESQDSITFKDSLFVNSQNKHKTHNLTYAIAGTARGIAYPTLSFMDSELKSITVQPGYLTPDQIKPLLVFIAEDKYQTENFDDFYSRFDPSEYFPAK